MRTLIRTIPDLVWMKDPQGVYLACNSRFEEFFGAKEKDIIGKTDYDFVDRELADFFRMHDQRAAARGMPSINEEQVIFAGDGHREILETIKTPVYTNEGHFLGVLGIGRDITHRKQAEEDLQESLLRQKEAVKAANVGLWDWDLITNKVQFSFEWKRQIGYGPDEISNTFEEWESRVHPQDLETMLQKTRQSITQKNQEHQIEFRFRHKEGHYLWILAQASVLMDASGQPVRMVGSHIDITDQKKALESKMESEIRYRTLFEYAPYGILIANEKSYYLDVNPSLCRMLGYTRDELIGLHASDIVVPTEIPHIEPALEEIKTTSDYTRVWQFQRKDGSFFEAEVSVTTIPKNHLLGIVRDITERRKAEQDLRESEEKLRLFIEHAPAALAMFDNQMHYIAASHGWMADYGLTGREIIGQSHYTVFPEIPDRWKTAHQRGLKGEVLRAEEDSFERIDGTTHWLHWEVRPWHKADGAVGGIVIFTADLTERKEMEAAQLQLKDQLLQAQKMESVGRLAGGVAHDYNNMLSVIIGYSKLALEKLNPSDPLHGDLLQILDAGKRSMNITRQLLAFARKQTIAPKVLDLNQTVTDTLKMLRQLIGENIDLSWNPGKGIWPIKIGPAQVDQILANLIINAKDAIIDVGKITIETGLKSFDEDYCQTHAGFIPGDFIMLGVSDNGFGMPPETLEKIFEPFFTTKSLGTGTGLGLSTVYGIVKQNNGFINVYSEPDSGTTFKIYLPRHGETPLEDEETEAGVFPESRGETLLVVEDESAILKLAEKILSALHYRVLVAENPAQALDLAKAHSGEISLLITDVIMPGMNGKELHDKIQTIFPGLKCLFMSGYTANVIVHHGVLDKELHFIQKPFSIKELAKAVRNALAG